MFSLLVAFIICLVFYFIIKDYSNAAEMDRQEEERDRIRHELTPFSITDEIAALKKIHEFIPQHFPFYHRLSYADQIEFDIRVLRFINGKRIVGMEGFVMTDEVKIIVAVPAIRLTFGLLEYALPSLRTIGVYPGIFYNKLLRREVKGLTFATGVMYLSYEDLISGNRTEIDHINLGLHEMAHAFKIEIDKNDSVSSAAYNEMEELIEHAEVMAEQVRNGELWYLRQYAGANADEFFAVCVENFFEEPQKFKLYMPNTYEKIAMMLNLSTTN